MTNQQVSKSISKEAESNNPEQLPESAQPVGEERPRIRVNKESLFPFITGAGLLFTGFLAFLVYRTYIWSAFLAILLFVGFDGLNRRLQRTFGGFRWGRDISAVLSSVIVMTITIGPAIIVVRLLISEAIQIFFQLKEILTGDKIDWLLKKAKIEPRASFLYKDAVGHLTGFNNRKNKNRQYP